MMCLGSKLHEKHKDINKTSQNPWQKQQNIIEYICINNLT